MRQILLDTETTGLSPQQGHRVIEIGCVELINRRLTGKTFHTYLQPSRLVDPGAMRVHGITDDFLKDKPLFNEIATAFKGFITGAELIIHNAAFDVGFLENEFLLLEDKEWVSLDKHCAILDTLMIARQKHPGQRNNLDALCKRYGINNSHRDKHGALLDAHILADVYLAMTGGQNTLSLEETASERQQSTHPTSLIAAVNAELMIIKASEEELRAHRQFLDKIEGSGISTLWRENMSTNLLDN